MILIDYKDRRPLYEQIEERFRDLILHGAIETDTKIPSVRSLAMDLSINPNTIQRAYAELESAGYIYSVKGRGNFVADIAHLMPAKQAEFYTALDALLTDAHSIGITQSDITTHMNEFYEKEGNHS